MHFVDANLGYTVDEGHRGFNTDAIFGTGVLVTI